MDLQTGIQQLRSLLPPTVHDQLVAGGEEGLTDDTLRRWLVARKMNVKTAAAHLQEHAAWRSAWTPNKRISESEVAADMQQDKIFVQGCDPQGRPVILLQAAKHTMTQPLPQQRFITYCLDVAIACCDSAKGNGNIVGIFDLQGFTYKNCDATGLKNVFVLLQSHYVERLHKLYMYAAPTIFWGLWKIVKPFVDPVTAEKVVFVPEKDTLMLQQAVGRELLPPYLGGTAELVSVQVVGQRQAQAAAAQPHHQQQQAQGDKQPTHAGMKHATDVLVST